MNQPADQPNALGLSYLRLRKMVGILGSGLPFVLAIGKIIFDGPGLQGSISAYYYTGMRNVFVGILFAQAVFLISYNMYKKDYIAGRLAGAFSIGVALFPTTPALNPTSSDKLAGAVHLTCAAAFFLLIAYFSLFLFTKTDPAKTPTPQKLQRNRVYRACGIAILVCLALIVGAELLPAGSPLKDLHPVFWLESLAVVAFGVSWLVKGEAVLQDE